MKKTVSFIYMGLRILPDTPLAKIAKREGLISEGQDLLEPAFYIAPGIDRDWLEKMLTDGFAGLRHCVFPPDLLDSSLAFLYRLGHVGFLWDMVLTKRKRPRGKRRRHGTE